MKSEDPTQVTPVKAEHNDIDQSLIASQLRRTVAERIAVHERALALALALRGARRASDA